MLDNKLGSAIDGFQSCLCIAMCHTEEKQSASVAALLLGMRPAHTCQKDILMPTEKLKL